ncbi:MAG TPA: septation protein SepH [Propionibacteriaceae bacterium]|nr:septation protein SepH [Propionibacteriaceae bacterium]
MRTARLVGLSPDGKSLIVATESGEEFMIEADERLRAALRGDLPRLGQLEIEMQTSLTPRDIQARIRAGETLEDVARVAGIPMDRVERFAAPVLAEREHVASMAMASSVRRRGEPSGHRSLRITVTERLLGRGIDIDAITWDSYRLDDGRWAVTADYRSGDSGRHASFFYDLRGRFSVAANDEARWLLGDQPSARGSQRGRPRLVESTEEDTEPTLVSDKVAFAKAAHESRNEDDEPTVAVSRALRPVADPSNPRKAHDEATDESPIGTLYEMLGGDGYSEDSPRVYEGLSDATAVPETGTRSNGGWEPAIVINYPVEPSMHDEAVIASPQPEEHSVSSFTDTAEPELPGTDEPGPPDQPANLADRTDEAHEFEIESVVHVDEPTERKSVKRKRASVPSWDEIMFGGPKRQS